MLHILRGTCTYTCRNLWFDARSKESLLCSIDSTLDSPRAASLPHANDTLLHRLRLQVTYTEHFVNAGIPMKMWSTPYCTTLVFQHNEMNYTDDFKLATDTVFAYPSVRY